MSEDRDSWGTPKKLFNWLNARFGGFTIDAAASHENALVRHYYTKEHSLFDGGNFGPYAKIFCNPPYSMAGRFAEHLYKQYVDFGAHSVLLLPVRSDRLWFNKLRISPGVRIEWYTGRIFFSGSNKGAFMYSTNFIFGFDDVCLVDPIDASQFNNNGKGGART